MNRLSERERQRWVKLSQERNKRNARSRKRRSELRRLGLNYQDADRPRSMARVTVSIKAPPVLSMVGAHYEATMSFFNAVRQEALKKGRRVVLDLRKCTNLSPEITLLLVAEVQRIKALKGRTAVTGLSPVDDASRLRLHAMGVFIALEMVDPTSFNRGDDQTPLFPIRTGTALDGAITKELAEEFGAALGLDQDRTEIVQKAFNEALENISEHAYYDPDTLIWPAEAGRWWIAAIANPEKQGAYLMACDLGMTIPATVPATAKMRGERNLRALAEYVSANISKTEDERLLGAAFQEGVTRREEQKGGRGLGKMAALVHEFAKGHLTVWSGGAMAQIVRGKEAVRVRKLPRSFDGTYVFWHIGQEQFAE